MNVVILNHLAQLYSKAESDVNNQVCTYLIHFHACCYPTCKPLIHQALNGIISVAEQWLCLIRAV